MNHLSSLSASRSSRSATSEEGSAFIIVLLALLLLTTLGLALVLVTETEMEMGGGDRVINQTFYAADSGVQAALGKLLTTQDWSGAEFVVVEGQLGTDRQLGERVATTRVHAIGAPRPAPMTIANEGQDDYRTYFVVVTSTADRVSWPQTDAVPSFADHAADVTVQAQSTTSSRYLLSPLRQAATPEEPFNGDEVYTEQ